MRTLLHTCTISIFFVCVLLFSSFFSIHAVSAVTVGGAKENCQNLTLGRKYAEFILVFGPNSGDILNERSDPSPANPGNTLCFEVEDSDTTISLASMDLQTTLINSSWATYESDREKFVCGGSWSDDQGGTFSNVPATNLEILLQRDAGSQICAGQISYTIRNRYRYFIELPAPQEYVHFYFNGFHTGTVPLEPEGDSGEQQGLPANQNNPDGAVDTSASGEISSVTQEQFQAALGDRYNPPPGYNGVLPTCAFRGDCNSLNDLLVLAVNVGKFVFQFIGVAAFAMFVLGGFFMITSFGNAEKFKKGQEILVAAIVGMIISFGAYLLINFILDALQVSDYFLQ